jgi:hypothetical protein
MQRSSLCRAVRARCRGAARVAPAAGRVQASARLREGGAEQRTRRVSPTLKPGARVGTATSHARLAPPDAELFYPGRTDDGLVLPPLPRVLAARGGAGSPGGGAAGSEGSPSYTEHKAKTPPPDLPSLLLDSRIVYLGMPVREPSRLAQPLLQAATHSPTTPAGSCRDGAHRG